MRLFFLAVIAALTLLFFHKLAFTDLILARGDTYQYFYPLWAARDAALSQGRLPLWTPDVFMGAPLLSDPQLGTLYPPNWLTINLSPPDAIRISILIHVTWAALGAFFLARRVGLMGMFPALASAVLFAFGGYIGAHVEQINQLQGLSWLPWAFLVYTLSFETPFRFGSLLAAIFALQLFSGHTQTVFMTGFGLGVYGVVMALLTPPPASREGEAESTGQQPDTKRTGQAQSLQGDLNRSSFTASLGRGSEVFFKRIRPLLILAFAAIAAGVLALPQLYPTLELTGLSNRGGGLNQLQAMAFSWNPLLAARGLLPSYDGQIFGEYIATVGVIGLGLALIGAANLRRNTVVWLVLALLGIILALGAYTPVYWPLAGLPGFNLFRVPARWLALFALGSSILVGIGLQVVMVRRPQWRTLAVAAVVIVALAASTLLADGAANEVNGSAQPTLITVGAWIAAGGVFMVLVLGRKWVSPGLIMLALVVELFGASLIMPFNDLADPSAYHDARFSVYQLKALYGDQTPPGRLLSISNLYFDPGDKAGIAARYSHLGQRALDHSFTAAKLKEVVAPNLPLVWNIPSVDGFGGGLVPSTYYTQFTSLMLPPDILRTVDGRLRENLAQPMCRGACIPDQRWLNLTNTRYLITDKTYDVVVDGVFFDTTFEIPLEGRYSMNGLPDFTADSLHILFKGQVPTTNLEGQFMVTAQLENELQVGVIEFSPRKLEAVTLEGADTRLVGLSLVDSRTGDFVQWTPMQRVLSSDIKLYENDAVFPRAFVVHETQSVPDDWIGTEYALQLMGNVDLTKTVVLSGTPPPDPLSVYGEGEESGRVPVEGVSIFVGSQNGQHECCPYRESTVGTTLVSSVSSPSNRRIDHTPSATRPSSVYGGRVGDEGLVSTAHIIDYQPERVEVLVNVEKAGYLFLSDAYYPGWTVTINNEPATLYRANAMFRAVRVPEGESTVVFSYTPAWLPGVFIIGGVGWAALILGILLSLKLPKYK